MVGVLRGADTMSLGEIAARSRELVRAIEAGHGTRDQLTGSTFTVSNLGMYGVDGFTPIVNPPEVAILGVGRIREHPVPAADGRVAWRSMVPLSLTVDHRAVDGVPAAQFLAAVASRLAEPGQLIDLR
jgi:pyruvate dehydrogenase E2 component (dihydrolipoamide acetyltransferase)